MNDHRLLAHPVRPPLPSPEANAAWQKALDAEFPEPAPAPEEPE